jgi:RraA family protein
MSSAAPKAAATPKSAQLHCGPGFRIRKTIERPAPEVVEAFKQFAAADVSDMLNRLYTMKPEIKNYTTDTPICGPATTVKCYPGDNLMVHKVLDLAKPGDVLVIDAGSSDMNAIVGDLISTKAKFRGIHAFVVDGLIRDVEDIKEISFPVFARGVTPIGPLHRGPGEINYPVACGGIVVNPGDLIVGDRDGVVVVRQDFAEDTLQRLIKQKNSSAGYEENVKKGIFNNDWVDVALEAAGCVIED